MILDSKLNFSPMHLSVDVTRSTKQSTASSVRQLSLTLIIPWLLQSRFLRKFSNLHHVFPCNDISTLIAPIRLIDNFRYIYARLMQTILIAATKNKMSIAVSVSWIVAGTMNVVIEIGSEADAHKSDNSHREPWEWLDAEEPQDFWERHQQVQWSLNYRPTWWIFSKSVKIISHLFETPAHSWFFFFFPQSSQHLRLFDLCLLGSRSRWTHSISERTTQRLILPSLHRPVFSRNQSEWLECAFVIDIDPVSSTDERTLILRVFGARTQVMGVEKLWWTIPDENTFFVGTQRHWRQISLHVRGRRKIGFKYVTSSPRQLKMNQGSDPSSISTGWKHVVILKNPVQMTTPHVALKCLVVRLPSGNWTSRV